MRYAPVPISPREGTTMSLKTILFAGIAATSLFAPLLLTPARAGDDTYMCNDGRCYDDQAAETRRLNILQAEHPGAGVHAVPGYNGPAFDDRDNDEDRNGYNDNDEDDRNGYGDRRDDDRGYGSDDDRNMRPGARGHYRDQMPPNDEQPYSDDDRDDDQ